MSETETTGAAASRVGVTTRAESPMPSGHWLLSAAPSIPQAQLEWATNGAAWLRPGGVFSAATGEEGIVHAAVGLDSPEKCAGPLADAVTGPLFYTPRGAARAGSYTALMSAVVGELQALPGLVMHPPRALLLVPAPETTAPTDGGPWWVLPVRGPEVLCRPSLLAGLVVTGRQALGLEGALT
ncbi:hypothetical protein OG923_20710 [Streptomyces halstedii]|uniref:hypothetical protein n=1 Tax=Streptomyces halstedii TaxID=1944 RepID=UPI00324F4F19